MDNGPSWDVVVSQETGSQNQSEILKLIKKTTQRTSQTVIRILTLKSYTINIFHLPGLIIRAVGDRLIILYLQTVNTAGIRWISTII